jgi:hypothetical protein
MIDRKISTSNRVPLARLRAAIVSVAELKAEEKAEMFELMREYYDSATERQFLSDLSRKCAVILLRDREQGCIRGFSTLARIRVTAGRKMVRAVFSGDTVIEKNYWGQRALGKAFLRFLLIEKLKRPIAPLYWLLITKGYKTYLMMANNFAEHYPRFERATPSDKKAIIDAFYSTLFAEHYDPRTGLIEHGEGAYRLKSGVAAISETLVRSNPRIAFFQQANPAWSRGVELACIARMTLFMPVYYALKVFMKDRLFKLPAGASSVEGSSENAAG